MQEKLCVLGKGSRWRVLEPARENLRNFRSEAAGTVSRVRAEKQGKEPRAGGGGGGHRQDSRGLDGQAGCLQISGSDSGPRQADLEGQAGRWLCCVSLLRAIAFSSPGRASSVQGVPFSVPQGDPPIAQSPSRSPVNTSPVRDSLAACPTRHILPFPAQHHCFPSRLLASQHDTQVSHRHPVPVAPDSPGPGLLRRHGTD